MATYSNAAYDLSLFSNGQRGKIVSIEENKKQKREAKRRSLTQTIASAAVVAVIGAVILTAVLAAIISKVRLTEMNEKISDLDSQLSILQSENVRLNSELTEIASSEQIDAYAAKHGLQKMENGQIHYFSVEGGDHVEKAPKTEETFLDHLRDLF